MFRAAEAANFSPPQFGHRSLRSEGAWGVVVSSPPLLLSPVARFPVGGAFSFTSAASFSRGGHGGLAYFFVWQQLRLTSSEGRIQARAAAAKATPLI